MIQDEYFDLFKKDIYYQHLEQIYSGDNVMLMTLYNHPESTEFNCETLKPGLDKFVTVANRLYNTKLKLKDSLCTFANAFRQSSLSIVFVDVRKDFMGVVVADSLKGSSW